MAKATVPQRDPSAVACQARPTGTRGVGEGSSYLLAGVLSIKLWFMQIMRVQKLVCPAKEEGQGAGGKIIVAMLQLTETERHGGRAGGEAA